MTSTTTCGGPTTSGSTPPPDAGARRNSPNKDSSSKKLSNTLLPIHRRPQVQARKQRRRPPLRHDATRRCRGRRRGCRRNRGSGSQRTIRGLTEATGTALRRDDSSGRTTIRPEPRRLSSFFAPRRAWQRPCANGSNRQHRAVPSLLGLFTACWFPRRRVVLRAVRRCGRACSRRS